MKPEEDPTPSLNLFSYGLHRWRRWGQKSEQRGEFQGFRFHRGVQSGLAVVHLLSLRFISDVRLAVSKEQREKSPKPAPEAMSRAGLV